MLTLNLSGGKLTQAIRSYLPFVLLALGLAAALVWFSRENDSFSARLAELDVAHKVEIEKINKIRETERKEYEKNLAKFYAELQRIDEKYAADIKRLEVEKQQKTEKYVEKYTGNPLPLAQKVSEVTGFVVYTGDVK